MNNTEKPLPPYVSYKKFKDFLQFISTEGLPPCIDKSFWEGKFSATAGSQITGALRFLKLTDNDNKPEEIFKNWSSADEEEQKKILSGVIKDAYKDIFSIDIVKATSQQLDNAFSKYYKAEGEVKQKCITFFKVFSQDVGIKLSTYIVRRKKRQKRIDQKNNKKTIITNNKVGGIVPSSKIKTEDKDWNILLLEKFPEFDPSWNDEIKSKWFSAFDELMKRKPSLEKQDKKEK